MTQKQDTVVGNNELIAGFMGETIRKDGKIALSKPEYLTGQCIVAAKYHTSWDWLMPCVEKIEGMGFEFTICQFSALIMNDWENIPEPVTLEKLPANKRFERNEKSDSKIVSTWRAVVQFVTWYNNQ